MLVKLKEAPERAVLAVAVLVAVTEKADPVVSEFAVKVNGVTVVLVEVKDRTLLLFAAILVDASSVMESEN